ncbi:MAG: LptF/LptG family permease [Elusimicrobiota bacterium]
MKKYLLQKYFIFHYIRPFIYGLFIVWLLTMISQFFDRLDLLVTNKPAIQDIIAYLLLRSPFWTLQILPIITLLALLFALNNLSHTGELTAIKSAGVDIYKFIKPVFYIGILLSLTSFYFFEYVIIHSNAQSDYIFRTKFKNAEPNMQVLQTNVFLVGQNGQYFTANLVDPSKNELQGFVMESFDNDFHIKTQTISKRAVWDKQNSIWTLYDTVDRRYNANEEIVSQTYKHTKTVPLNETINDFVYYSPNLEEMNFIKLKQYITSLRLKGRQTAREEVQYHMKFSYPLANLVVLIFGLYFGLLTQKSGKLRSFSICLISTFLYWGVLSVSRSVGDTGRIPPLIAAWLPNVLFTTIGAILLTRVHR